MRINARLDRDHALKLQFIGKTTGLGVTDIIKEALSKLYNDFHHRQTKRSLNAFKKSGFVGCSKGPQDLSEKAKSYLLTGLKKRHDHR